MIFRQLFDSVSGTYSYLLASRHGGEALILDPVLEKADRYCQLLRELDLKLVKAVDSHLHADHVTGLGELRDRTHCITIMGEQSKADLQYCDCQVMLDRTFYAPIWDKSWPDDTLVEFEYMEDAP